MTTFDNGPILDGWSVPTGRHCGDYCWERDCPVCGLPADPFLGEHVELGEN